MKIKYVIIRNGKKEIHNILSDFGGCMKYYKTGEFANKANVSIRTIRYYDNQGLLKPSKINKSGYRLYTDQDFVKLQQILALKYLGFSLDEIFSMTASNDLSSLQKSLSLQSKLVKQKIEHLQLVETTIKETIKLLKENKNIDWNNILKLIHLSTMEHDVVNQYKNSTNINIRISLHEKYSVNPLTWYEWLYGFYHIQSHTKVLEIGCGNGQLWVLNKALIPNSCYITVSDISPGMVIDAKSNLKDINNIHFDCFDCHHIPYDDNNFDIVIANHVMFYLKDIHLVLKEIKRVLKPNGYFYCSTYGQNHMKEITTLVKEYDSRITLSHINLYEIFGLENGLEILKKEFENVKLEMYNDYLLVDNIDDIANYILSCHGNQAEYLSKNYDTFKKYLEIKIEGTRPLKITKEAGVFICQINDE